MVILIAESKTMSEREYPVTPEEYALHKPAGETAADEIMAEVARMTPGEISSALKISGKLALKVRQMAYEFPNKLLGIKAIESFTGVVFNNLSYASLPESAVSRLNSTVRIISSLYGWLQPDDLIKPYRLEYNSPIAPGDRSLFSFLRRDVTIALVNYLKTSGETNILHLLPGDAAKCIDWKLVKNFAKVWKVDFKEVVDGTTTRTSSARLLKTLRGQLLRQILISDIRTPDELTTFATHDLIPLGSPDYPDHLAFAHLPA